jgi:hypothetical protein
MKSLSIETSNKFFVSHKDYIYIYIYIYSVLLNVTNCRIVYKFIYRYCINFQGYLTSKQMHFFFIYNKYTIDLFSYLIT